MGTYNEFAVVEFAVEELKQYSSDMGEEDTSIMKYRAKLWPGPKCWVGSIPNERMRIWFGKEDAATDRTRQESWFYVMLVEELRDVLAGLSIYQGKHGPYRILGLSAVITLGPPVGEETKEQTKAREDKLLNPILKLCFLGSAKVEGATPGRGEYLSEQVRRSEWDVQTIYSTFNELIEAGDEARKVAAINERRARGEISPISHYNVAHGYYRQASDYINHFIEQKRYVFTNAADHMACTFKLSLQRLRIWIEEGSLGSFRDALRAAGTALATAYTIFRSNPAMFDLGTLPVGDDRIERKWKSERLKAGAAAFGQRIKCEEIGAAYYYRSLAAFFVGGNAVKRQTEQDRLMAISCFTLSETASEDYANEFRELERRTMARVMPSRLSFDDSSDEWEDIDD